MRHAATLVVFGLGVLAFGGRPEQSSVRGADDKGTVVELDGLRSQTPASWKAGEPTNRFRAYEFRVAKAAGDSHDAELIIFYFGQGSGGTAADNVKRWKAMFEPPEGKKIDDVARVEKMKVGDVDVTYLDVQGTYLHKDRPFDPSAKVDRRPHYRLIGVVFESKKGPYFMRFTGPAKTIEQHKKGFDDWLKAFK